MTYQGVVKDGVIVFGQEVSLPDGTVVQFEPVSTAPQSEQKDPIYRLFELARPTGIPDFARNFDHYLYGHPRKEDK
jgi:hypothetical protein